MQKRICFHYCNIRRNKLQFQLQCERMCLLLQGFRKRTAFPNKLNAFFFIIINDQCDSSRISSWPDLTLLVVSGCGMSSRKRLSRNVIHHFKPYTIIIKILTKSSQISVWQRLISAVQTFWSTCSGIPNNDSPIFTINLITS
jgi:hypothetical protein